MDRGICFKKKIFKDFQKVRLQWFSSLLWLWLHFLNHFFPQINQSKYLDKLIAWIFLSVVLLFQNPKNCLLTREPPLVLKRNLTPFLKLCYLVTGYGDITYNSRSGLLGTICVSRNISYHLFTIDPYLLKAGDTVKLCRRSKWHPQYNSSKSKFNVTV